MTNSIGGATIELAVDSSGVESGLDRVDGAVRRTGRTLDSLRTQGGGALDSIGAGGSAAANRVDAATRNIAGAVERTNAALIAGKKSSSEYFEELGRSRGADMMKLAPLIAQLRETESAQARAKAAIDATTASQQAAAETARVQAAALREVAAAQASRDSYVAGLREQVALYGKSTEEVLRYKAAQAGAAEAAGPLILQLQNMRAAHEAIAESTRLEAQAQRQAAQAQANKDAFLATLREQAALHGKSAEEVLRYRAALAGAAADAEPMIQAITRMKAAQEAATASAKAAADAQQAATQAQAKGDAFLAGLREQVALYGKSTEEVLRYKAAQAGAANAAEPQIQKLQQLKVAQEAVTEAARLAAAAQQQAAQVQANRDTLLAGLREQIALYGKSTEEVLRYRAAQAGAVGAAEPLIQELARLKIAQDAVTEAARLAAAAQQQAAQQQVAGTAMIASLREQIALYGKTTEEVLRYKAAQAGVAGAAEPHIQELQRLKLAEEAVTTAARAAAEAQRAAATAQTGRDSFVTGLQQQAAAIGKTRADLLELQAAQMGVTTQAAPFIAKLREVEQGLNHAGMSARATAAAMRGVPAQFTDIVTSIQGGQAPLTVLLQQGGQLKDMFGGLGNAAKALGGYIVGLINPYTIAAAAAAVLAVAFVQGRNEAIAYNKALILAGATATTTAGQLSDMARNISKGVGTQGAAADAVLAMVATGKVAAGNLEQFSTVAIKAQRALGQSVDDTAAQFADLGKAPVATLLKLDETFHFLTAGVYEQIKALELQGRTVEAGTAAQQAWAAALGGASTKVAENLGSLQKAWKWVGDEAKGAWDSMLNIGRDQSLEQQLAAVQKRLASSAGAAGGKLPNGLTAGAESRSAAYAKQLAADLALKASLENQIATEKAGIAPKEAANKLREAGLKWAQDEEKYLTRVQLREQEIAKTRNQAAAAGVSQADTDARLSAIRLKYADTYNLAIDAQIEQLKRRGVVEEESAKRSMSTLAADRSAGLATSLLAEFKYAEDVAKLDQEALARKRALLVAELALTAAKPNSKKEQASLTGQIAEVDAQALTRAMQLKNDIATLDIKDTKQAMANLADLAVSRATDLQALQGQLQAQKDANALIGLSAAEVNNLNQALTEEAAKRLENQAALIGGNEARAAEASTLRASAVAMRELGVEKAKGVSLTANLDATKAKELLDILVAVDNAAKQAAQGMTDSFGRVGSAIGGLTTALSGYAVQQQAIAAQLAAVKVDKNSGADKIAQAELAATKASATAKVKSYADMAGAAKGFFKENTAGYRAMEGAEKAYRAVEMAMAVKAMIEKSGLLVAFTGLFAASKATEMAATVATVPVTVAAEGVKQTALATTAMAGAVAVPFPGNVVAFGIVAAMLAAIGLGGFGGGGGSVDVAKQRQAAAGTGSVLGDESAKSESISKSIENLEKYSSVGLNHTRGMLAALLNIQNTIGVVAAMATQTAGLRATAIDEKNFGVGSSSGVLGIGASSTTIQDSGIKLNGSQSIGSAISGIDAKGYVDIQKKNSGLWGIGASTSNRRDDVALDDSIKQQFGLVLASMRDGTLSAIQLLGMSSAGVVDKINSMALGVNEISFKGLTGAEIQKELEAVFSKVGDDIAKVAAPELGSFQKVGEGYLETLTRVATDYATIDSIMEATSKTFGAVGVASIQAREDLIKFSGGLDKLAEKNSYFIDNFFTDAEKAAPAIKYAAAEMAALGYSSVTTADQFKALVLSINPSTKAGGELYAKLLDLAPAFKAVADSAEAAKKEAKEQRDAQAELLDQRAQMYEANGDKAGAAAVLVAQHTLALQGMTPALAAATQATWAAQAAAAATKQVLDGVGTAYNDLQAVVNNQKEALNKAYQTSVDGIQAGIDRVTESVNNLKSLSQELHSTLDKITITTTAKDDRQLAQAQIESALAIAKAGGPLPDADALKGALAIVAKDASKQFSSFDDYQRDLYRTKNAVGGLAGISDAKLSADQLMLKAMQDSKKSIEDAHKEDIAYLDSTLKEAKTQSDLLSGIYTSLMTLPQALASMTAAVSVAQANPGVAATAGIASLYQSLLGRAPDSSGLAFYQAALAKGDSMDTIRQYLTNSPEYKKLHPFAVGTNLVPEDMPAMVHKDERIIPAADNRALMARLQSPAADNSALVAEVHALRMEVVKLQASSTRTADASEKTAKVVSRVGGQGDYFVTKAVPA
jgi:phage-related minor tail protein